MKRRKVYRRKIVGGFFGNIFTTIAENIPGIARKVAPIALDAGKAFATGAASSAGTAVGQKIADKIRGPSTSEIKRVISDIAPTEETKRAMIATTKKLLSPHGEEIVRKLVKKTKPMTPAAF
jgi:hypothetical protein